MSESTDPQTRTHTHLPGKGNRVPLSTYRLQLQPDFGFADAQKTLPLLHDLGVTDIYLSPILQAVPGSTHGYDVVDHSRINRALGGKAAFKRLADAAHDLGMGVIVDVVPNHMAVPTPLSLNKALWSVLRDGPESPYRDWFDLGDRDGSGILMPALGKRIGQVLAAGELTLDQGGEDEEPTLRYYDHVFPVKPGTEHLPLADLLDAQHYRLAYWKVADEELNYRRFFDVDTLAALRMEDRSVFDATHKLLLELFDGGYIDGFRIDHPDGMADPELYFRWLSECTGDSWVVAEKVLEADETLPNNWDIAGTTGYDTAWRIGSLFVDPNAGMPLTALAQEITDSSASLTQVIEDGKRLVANTSLHAELQRIATLANEICRDDIRLRDHTFRALAASLTELVIALDRYRAYVVPGQPASPTSERVIDTAAQIAATRLDPEYLDTLGVVVDLVLGNEVGSAGRAHEARRYELIVRFQQVSGAVMAKGVEDTAYYRWTPLISLTDVGGAPQFFGISPDVMHTWATSAAANWPATQSLLSTHDAKRSEDVRARINVISEYPKEWVDMIQVLDPLAEEIEGHTRNVLWQVLAGTWNEGFIEADRLIPYMVKVAREQKIWTEWSAPAEAAEAVMADVIQELLENEAVTEAFTGWAKQTEKQVRATVLGMKAVQLTAVGVADTYQGTERVQNFLVDPDNRAPLDTEALAEALEAVKTRNPKTLSEEKLALTRAILRLRREMPEVFVGARAKYRPLATSTGHVFAFARGDEPKVVTIASRLTRAAEQEVRLMTHTVSLPEGAWQDIVSGDFFAGGTTEIGRLLAHGPVAVLRKVDQ